MSPRARARVLGWFAERGWKPFRFQREVWTAYLRGESGLLHAATGTGKTLAVWMGPLLEALTCEPAPRPTDPLRVLWITPLRALASDTTHALREPLAALGIPWRVGMRTGDTPAAEKGAQERQAPQALVTTPESLSLLLTRDDHRSYFAGLTLVVVDEWHELTGSKRGVQVELALARLRRVAPSARVWGLSATLGNIDLALAVLLGGAPRATRPGRLVRGRVPKRIVVDTILPERIERFPWAGHIGTRLLPQVADEIESSATALVFTNVRSQAEIWHRELVASWRGEPGDVAIHHGSIDRERREAVEDGLRAGRLRAVVCTSSLDLGVDFTPVDRVFQVGSPKGVARLLQRAGRSGHRPGVPSRVTCVPTNALELVEVAAARDAIAKGEIEGRLPVERPLDVLAQHLITSALGGGFKPAELLDEVRTTWSYRGLTDQEWRFTLDFAAYGGATLRAYPEFQRLEEKDGRFVPRNAAVVRRHRLSVGTIVSDPAMDVRAVGGGRLGSVEESFVARLRPGDRFFFSGRCLELVRVHELTAWVRSAAAPRGIVPQWVGGRVPLSTELAAAVRRKLTEARNGLFRGAEMRAVRPVLQTQSILSAIPAADEILIERMASDEGHHVFVYPIEGRLVHEGLAALTAWRLARRKPATYSLACSDYGFELLSAEPAPLDEALADGLFSPAGLDEDIPASLNAAELGRRHFREIARVAGLVFPGYPGRGKPARHVQTGSELFYEVFRQHDPGNLLLRQAAREVLERQLERARLHAALTRLGRSRVVRVELDRPSPLAFPLMVDRLREDLTTEEIAERVRQMTLAIERKKDGNTHGRTVEHRRNARPAAARARPLSRAVEDAGRR